MCYNQNVFQVEGSIVFICISGKVSFPEN